MKIDTAHMFTISPCKQIRSMKTVYTIVFLAMGMFAGAQAGKVSIQLKLTDTQTGYFDVTSVAFQNGYQTTFQNSEDVAKVLNNGTSGIQFFTYTSDNTPTAVNGYNALAQTQTIQAGLNLYRNSTYSISVGSLQNIDPTTLVFLHDSETGQYINIQSTPYQFTADSGLNASRFSIRVSSPVGVYTVPADCNNTGGTVSVTIDANSGWKKLVLLDSVGSIAGYNDPIAGPVSFGALGEGNYTVQLFNTESSVNIPVAVQGSSVIAGIILDATTLNVNQPAIFKGMASKASYYTWNMGDGTQISGVANPEYAFLEAGVYEVTLRIANDFGCADTATKTVTVLEATGIANTTEVKPEIYAAGRQLHVKLGKQPMQDTRVNIYNIIGQGMFNTGVNGMDNSYDLTALQPGTYIVRLEQGRNIQTQKIYLP